MACLNCGVVSWSHSLWHVFFSELLWLSQVASQTKQRQRFPVARHIYGMAVCGRQPNTPHIYSLQQSLSATFEARNPIGFPAIFSWQENRRFSTILGGEKRTRRSPLASKLAPKDWIGGGEILIAIAEAPFVPFMCLLCFLNHSTVPTYFVAKECLLLWCLHKSYAKSWKPHILIKRKEVNVEKHYAQCNMLAHHYLLVLKTLSVKCIFNLFLL